MYVEIAKEKGTFSGGVHYASRLDGDAHAVFATLEESFLVTQEKVSHVTMTVNIAANSPSLKKVLSQTHQEVQTCLSGIYVKLL